MRDQALKESQPRNSSETFDRIFESSMRLAKQNQRSTAIDGLKKAVALEPKNYRAQFELANLYRLEHDFDNAIEHYLQAIAIAPNSAGPHVRLCFSELSDRQAGRVIARCRKLLEKLNGAHRIHATIAHMLDKRAQHDEAIEAMRMSSLTRARMEYLKQFDLTWQYANFAGPNFLVIGGMRCGSTSIFSYLNQHPHFIEPTTKEIHFFDQNYDKGLDWYYSHFPPIPSDSPMMTGDATPMFCWEGVAERVHRHLPNAKLILSLRNPVERAYSHFSHMVRWFGYNWEFDRCVNHDLENETALGINDPNYEISNVQSSLINDSLYIHWIREWKKYFSTEQMHIFSSEQLFNDAPRIVRGMFEFLKVPQVELRAFNATNKGSESKIEENLRKRLVAYFNPANEALMEELGVEFDWD